MLEGMARETKKTVTLIESAPSPNAVVLNPSCRLVRSGLDHLVLYHAVVVAQFTLGDAIGAALAMVLIVERGWAQQVEVARAFSVSERTVRRHQRRYEEGGLGALGRGPGCPAGTRRLAPSRAALVGKLHAAGDSNREMARQLRVTEKSIRKSLARQGLTTPRAQQIGLDLGPAVGADPNLSGSADPALESAAPSVSEDADPKLSGLAAGPVSTASDAVQTSLDEDPFDRRIDRLLAQIGKLDDAPPLFGASARVPGAGVLLAVPSLVASGVFESAREAYGSIGPAFYGLRTTVMTLLLMALLRIKRPESLKMHAPADLGRSLGLDRAPEVKTLRRKLARLAREGRAAEFGHAMAKRRVEDRPDTMGFLYIDGHVRVYSGEREIPKAHVTRMRIALPATTDYWVGDTTGDPLFVVTAQANAGLVKMLPPLLAEVRSLVGPERRVTVVFDRGGWSPKLFAQMIADGFDVLTYRKGRSKAVAKRRFVVSEAEIDGRKVSYKLADQTVVLRIDKGKQLRMRQVTRLTDDGHQTPIVTSRRDLTAIEVAFRMFERWRQENFFKYLREHFALDALIDYDTEPDDPDREVPNLARAKLNSEIREARRALAKAQADLTAASWQAYALGPQHEPPRALAIAVAEKASSLARLQARRNAQPVRVPVSVRTKGPVVKLSTERKHLSNILKMVAFQAETDLVRTVAPHYARADDEGRALIQAALASRADLAVDVAKQQLRVTLAPLSSAHRTKALVALCAELNAKPCRFPGSRLVLKFAVANDNTKFDRTG